jgi:anti-sigma factor RsiW
MSSACENRIPWETLVDYWAGDLSPADEDTVEQHLFECGACTADAARVASVTETLRAAIPPVLSRRRLEELRGRGMRVRENAFAPGDRREVEFAPDADLLVHRLGGLDLTGATRVRFTITAESSGAAISQMDDAPFDESEGAVLVACQRHYAALPHDTVFDVEVHVPGQAPRTATYTILHRFA